MGETISSYRDLKVWQRAMDLAERCYEETKSFPREEMYGMTAQLRRCSASVPANIAEGYGRESPGAYTQFLRVAQGSLKEFETHVLLSQRIGLLHLPGRDGLLKMSDEIGKMLRALIRSIERNAGK